MKKRIIFVMIAVLAVSFASTGSTAPKFLKKAKEKTTGKKEEKKEKKEKEEKKAPDAVINKDAAVVLLKGLQLKVCRNDLDDSGFITVPGLKNITDGEYDAAHAMKNSVIITVKNGKFDLTLPSNPVFGGEVESTETVYAQKQHDFGTTKVYYFQLLNFKNTRKSAGPRDDPAEGRVFLGFYLYYSEADVTGKIYDDAVTLKKGWNIIGDKTDLSANLDCREQ